MATMAGLTLGVTDVMALSIPSSVAHTRLLTRTADLKPEYDYVIVGGGTAGLTVADRLTEDGERGLPKQGISDSWLTDVFPHKYRPGDRAWSVW